MLSRRQSPGAIATALLAILVTTTVLASGQSFNFTPGGGTNPFTSTNVCANTSSPAAACQVLTNGSPKLPTVLSGGILRLNAANTNQHATAWFRTQQPLSTGFTTSFQFRISSTGACSGCGFPADGLAIVIQGDPAGTGAIGYTGNGQNISYGNNDVSGASGRFRAILNSLAIELDTHQNSDYSDPDGNHIAVQSCGPNTASHLTPNSADHNYQCPSGQLAKLALQSLPSGLSLSDGNVHTITVNYTAPGNVDPNAACNSNLCVYLDSNLLLQTNFDITQLLYLQSTASNNNTPATGAYIGFTAATGALVQNDDILSWSFSQLPLAPITITQPLQTSVTSFNYTAALSSTVDYSQSGLPANTFSGVFMQGTSQAITDQQFADLVNNTPFQGATCLHQDLGSGTFFCVVTSDLCTTSTSSTPAGANCPNTGTNALIATTNAFKADPAQKANLVAPAYLMAKDNALEPPLGVCQPTDNNTCKGLQNIFQSISGDPILTSRTKDFNSLLIPAEGVLSPSTSTSTSPALNSGWTNGGSNHSLTVTFNSTENTPSNNQNPPTGDNIPTVASINYSATGTNVPSPASGTINGATGSVTIPLTAEGTTTVSYQGLDSVGTLETITTNTGGALSSSLPTLTFMVDLTAPTFNCAAVPTPAWSATDATLQCTESDNAGGSGPATPNFSVSTAVQAGTETNAAQTVPTTVSDIAGNSTNVPAFGPFWIDKKAPVITGPTLNGTAVFGQNATASFSCADGGSGVVLCGPAGSQPIPATANTGTLSSPVDTSSAGSHTFTVNAQDAVGNQSTPATLSYTVQQATPQITWATPVAITYGTALSSTQLNATANVPGTFVYAPAAGTVLSAGNQTLTVTFTPTDTANYTTASASVTLVVNKATPTITWATPAPITFGTALSGTQLNATASVPGTFAYNPPAGTVPAAGTQTLSVTFTPTDTTNYTTATASVTLQVSKATPTITWATPAAITFGTPLSAAQLNATANVAGTFAYNPAAGAVLAAGSQTLSVTFTPTDLVDYTTASASVTILVTQPQISFSPPSFNFGTVLLGSVTTKTVVVSNPGNAPLTIKSIAFLGNNEDLDLFRIGNGCTMPVAPGGSCNVWLTFSASELESFSLTLAVTDNAPGGTQQIPVAVNVVRKH
jgi:hypothetical protein